jgi:hypothetical protein
MDGEQMALLVLAPAVVGLMLLVVLVADLMRSMVLLLGLVVGGDGAEASSLISGASML